MVSPVFKVMVPSGSMLCRQGQGYGVVWVKVVMLSGSRLWVSSGSRPLCCQRYGVVWVKAVSVCDH